MGLAIDISGQSVTYATGGDGGSGTTASAGVAAASNLGNGGGGASFNTTGGRVGGAGGSGLVVVRYLGSAAGSGGTVTSGSGTASGYTLHSFTSAGSGSISLNALNVMLSGTISGSGSMVNNATGGKISLMSANTYQGTTTLNGGTLGIYNMSAISSGALIAANNTTLLLGRGITGLSNNITLNGAVTAAFDTSVDYLIVAGGGGGGSSGTSGTGGRGGAGGLPVVQKMQQLVRAVLAHADGFQHRHAQLTREHFAVDDDAFARAAVFFQHNNIVRYVEEASRQISCACGIERGVGQTFAGAVRRDEVLQDVQAFAEVRGDRRLDDRAVGLGHQAAHAGELLHLLRRTASARMAHHVNEIGRAHV